MSTHAQSADPADTPRPGAESDTETAATCYTRTEPVGWIVRHRTAGVVGGKVWHSREVAAQKMAALVWHSREGCVVVPVYEDAARPAPAVRPTCRQCGKVREWEADGSALLPCNHQPAPRETAGVEDDATFLRLTAQTIREDYDGPDTASRLERIAAALAASSSPAVPAASTAGEGVDDMAWLEEHNGRFFTYRSHERDIGNIAWRVTEHDPDGQAVVLTYTSFAKLFALASPSPAAPEGGE